MGYHSPAAQTAHLFKGAHRGRSSCTPGCPGTPHAHPSNPAFPQGLDPPPMQRLPPVLQASQVAGAPSGPACNSWETPGCTPVPNCGGDACVRHPVPPPRPYDMSYQHAGVDSFIRVFEAGVARGIENATIRAFNSTRICPTCNHPPQTTEPCPPAPSASYEPTSLPEQNPPVSFAARSTGSKRFEQPPAGASQAPRPTIYWHEPSQSYRQLDAFGRTQQIDPAQLPQLHIRRNVVTGVTDLRDEMGNQWQVDPETVPPYGVWWNLPNRRLETIDSQGNLTAFGDPRSRGFRFRSLTDRFTIEIEEVTKRVILTHNASGRSFAFEPRAT